MAQQKMARLVIYTAGGNRYHFPLERKTTLIGRSRDCTLVVDDPNVSRHHARIRREGGRYVLLDEGSTNGTFVGGERVGDPRVLSHLDNIQIGQTMLSFVEQTAGESTTKRLEPAATGQAQPPIRVDFDSWEVWVSDKRLQEKLSVLEFKLLGYLYRHANAVCRREDLCREVWGEGAYTYAMLHQLVYRLKRRIEPEPGNPRYLVSVAGVGYKLNCISA